RVLFFWHTVANRLLTLFSNICTNLNLTDMETCYKVFRADILRRIPIRSNRFGLEPELTAKVAHLRCRVYEVPIAYHGRQYSEGKKIGWKDGFSALWTIFRFALRHDTGREDEGYTTLRRVEVLRRYTAFLWDLMRPYVGRRVLALGSGIGVMTPYLALLAPGGRVVLIVPALHALYGTIDVAIGHHRRYTREEIDAKLRAAGLEVEHVSYFNLLGVPGWWLNARVLRRRSVPGLQARLN